jgi:O-antigen/teichoic acid export membrane protein
MNHGRIYIKNITSQAISTAGRVGLGFIISILVARYWGPSSYGQYAALIAFMLLFKFSVDWGLGNLIVREISRDKAKVDEYTTASLVLILGMSILAGTLIIVIDRVVKVSADDSLLIILAILWLVIGGAGIFFSCVFIAFERMEFDTWTVLAEVFTAVLLIILILPSSAENLTVLMLILVAARVVNVIVSILIYRRYIGNFVLGIETHLLAKLLRMTAPFGLHMLLANQANIHIVLLNNSHGNEAAGLYKAAEQITIIFMVVPVMISNTLYPALSRVYKEIPAAFQKLMEQGLHYMLVISLPLMIGIFLLSDRLIVLIFGLEYQSSSGYASLLSFSLPLAFLSNMLAIGMTSADKQGQRTIILAVAALMYIMTGLILIPRFNLLGTCLVVLIVAVAKFIMFLIGSVKSTGWLYPVRHALPVIIASSILYVFIQLTLSAPLFLIVLGGGVIYSVALLFLDKTLRDNLNRLNIREWLASFWGTT